MSHPLIAPIRCMPHNPRAVAASFDTTNIVGYWKMETDTPSWLDSGPNALHLSGVNSPTVVAGKFGNGAQVLSASNQYLQRASVTDFALSAGESFTIAIWVNAASWATGATRLIYDSSFKYALYLDQSPPTGAVVYFNGQTHLFSGFSALSTGAWHLIVGGYDHSDTGSEVFMSWNNAAKSKMAKLATPNWAAPNITVSSTSAVSFPINGVVDNALIYKRALSGDEITALYNGNGPY